MGAVFYNFLFSSCRQWQNSVAYLASSSRPTWLEDGPFRVALALSANDTATLSHYPFYLSEQKHLEGSMHKTARIKVFTLYILSTSYLMFSLLLKEK